MNLYHIKTIVFSNKYLVIEYMVNGLMAFFMFSKISVLVMQIHVYQTPLQQYFILILWDGVWYM